MKVAYLFFAMLLFAMLMFIVVDMWLIFDGGMRSSFSVNVYKFCQENPIVPLILGLVFGIIIGHIFWANPVGGNNGY